METPDGREIYFHGNSVINNRFKSQLGSRVSFVEEARKNMAKQNASTVTIPRDEWGEFLRSFGQRRHGWLVTLETYDLDTREKVDSHETPLQSIELDLEDEKNPRINITVKLDNKVIKHILFQPSQLIWYRPQPGTGEALHIESVNTVTTVRFRAPISP